MQQAERAPERKQLPPEVQDAVAMCRILEANNNAAKQASLGVTNQQYQELRINAKNFVLTMALQLHLALKVLHEGNAGNRRGLLLEYERHLEEWKGDVAAAHGRR